MSQEGEYLCSCGAHGFVDLGEVAANRYPCKTCYQTLRKNRPKNQEYLSFFETPAGMVGLNWPSNADVLIAEAKKNILQNSEISS